MALFDWLTGFSPVRARPIEPMEINPATGLPMTAGIGSMDVAGNPYGIDLRHHEDLHDYGHHGSAGSMFDDWSHGSGITGGHDPFGRW